MDVRETSPKRQAYIDPYYLSTAQQNELYVHPTAQNVGIPLSEPEGSAAAEVEGSCGAVVLKELS